MAKPTPNPEPQRNRAENERRLQAAIDAINGRGGLPAEPKPAPAPAAAATRGIWRTEEPALQESAADPAESERLKLENEELRMEVTELRQLLDEAAAKGAPAGGSELEKEIESLLEEKKEFENILEEKTEMIRNLYLKIQELEQQASAAPAAPAAPPPANQEELLAMSDELERERCQLDQERRQMEDERRQLKEDEDSMMTQMREMEVQMAKERAEMARQRNELQRLHSEIRHEIEVAQRDGLLNERLRTLQRKHQEVSNRKGAAPDMAPPPSGSSGETQVPSPQERPKEASGSGVLRRFFGKGK